MSHADPQDIAKQAVRLLEQALYDRYGVEVHAGMELEYSLVFDPKKLRYLPEGVHDNPLQIPKQRGRQHFIPANKKLIGSYVTLVTSGDPAAKHPDRKPMRRKEGSVIADQDALEGSYDITINGSDTWTRPVADPLFPHSNWIAYNYVEDKLEGVENAVMYETVISHNGPHDKVAMGKGRLNILARAAEGLRKLIANPGMHTDLVAEPEHNRWLNQVRDAIAERHVGAVVALGESNPTFITQGLHLNLSLTKDGKTLPVNDANHFPTPLSECLTAALTASYDAGAYLLLPHDNSYERLKLMGLMIDSNGIEQKYSSKNNKIHFKDYFEIKRPGADSNPYYTVMLALVGILHGLEAGGYGNGVPSQYVPSPLFAPLNKLHNAEPMPKQVGHLRQQIEARWAGAEGDFIKETLNTLEPALGERFIVAINKTPPGKEAFAQRHMPLQGGITC